jgi:hypothetical protein
VACGDNCTFFELPNVFTPNGDGCNDTFSAYYQEKNDGEEAPCQVLALQLCPRFVNRIYFKVFNRWGQKVYFNSYEGDTQTITINWNGKTNDGVELASSVYYYTADIEFDTTDPSKKNKRINGWVQLIR